MPLFFRCPSRFAGGELIKSDDDLLMLKTAEKHGGIVLSNDHFEKYWDPYPKYREVIKYRVIQANFILGELSLPDDPLGEKGPTLERFIRFEE